MTKTRNRSQHTTSLEERLANFANELRQQAEKLPSDTEEALELQRRIRDTEAARRINASLTGHSDDTSA